MVVWANNTSHVEECHNDEADYTPTREAYQEALDVKRKLLLPREIRVRLVSDRIDMCDTFELLAKIFSIMLYNIVIPKNV